jgi:hypothetical protein
MMVIGHSKIIIKSEVGLWINLIELLDGNDSAGFRSMMGMRSYGLIPISVNRYNSSSSCFWGFQDDFFDHQHWGSPVLDTHETLLCVGTLREFWSKN